MLVNITNAIIKIFGDNQLSLNEIFDAQNVLQGTGELTVSVEDITKLHPLVNDYSINYIISGQTLIEDDKKKQKINDLFHKSNLAVNTFTAAKLKEESNENVVGVIINNARFDDDQHSCVFNIDFTVYACDLIL